MIDRRVVAWSWQAGDCLVTMNVSAAYPTRSVGTKRGQVEMMPNNRSDGLVVNPVTLSY
ncbi:hypothetical protein PILCRDRAFT_811361 [Piloderma croceum F 1598]|uniref:Uncharacterized protein n=1 Tax=Piloderma croceum (strain F 1598) TaxID=765440 RepID=A0A0C3G3K1_PILCF|nr:hypothetical protein PILCRDRAFT_811361 [Piloderma croceum F 1598]